MKTIKILCSAVFFLFAFSSMNATSRAWAWYNCPTSTSCTPQAEYQFNSKRGTITGKRLGKGSYELTFPNLGAEYAGVFHAVAYGGNHSAQVHSWRAERTGSLKVKVLTYSASGEIVDGKFVVSFTKAGPRNSNSAYQWVDSYTDLNKTYKWNSKGQANIVTRTSKGIYQVTFRGMQAVAGKKGNVQVTPYGRIARRAKVLSWGVSRAGLTATIHAYDMDGQLADTKLVISYINDFLIGQSGGASDADLGAYVWANNSTARLYTPNSAYSLNNANDNTQISNLGTGRYKVRLPYLPHNKSSMVMATAYGRTNAYVSVEKWEAVGGNRGTDVYIRTFAPDGTPTPAQFTLFYYTNRNILY